ncbi:hypothetical protein NEMBOFW57_006273 [Staphylotrichum longicolle]|uniref:DUF7702 domain-containing protein n=1 Tax=Staphylotrichum longicolle TaxID=669026 RepID=A0AAD4EYQ8_9PEZI|nr:hypothetical protein NEMBOFW57_006273 [Staphylotrichum longicolle]
MALDDNNIVSIVEIAVYVPTIIVSFFICMRHGFGKSSGVDWVNSKKTSPLITVRHFRLIQLVILVGTILAIVGASKSNKGTSAPTAPAVESEVAVVLYAVSFAAVALVLLLEVPSISLVPEAERIIVPAVGLALPFIAVRVLYSLLLVFVHTGVFSRTGGPVSVRVGMSVVEEFVVVAIYLFLGFRLPKLDKSEHGEILSRSSKNGRGRSGRLLARFSGSDDGHDLEHGRNNGGEQGASPSAYYGRPGQ